MSYRRPPASLFRTSPEPLPALSLSAVARRVSSYASADCGGRSRASGRLARRLVVALDAYRTGQTRYERGVVPSVPLPN
jgi:hypothetical protein